MYKFELNADLREVWLRLAGRYAGVAQVVERGIRTSEVGSSSDSTGSMLQEDDQESE